MGEEIYNEMKRKQADDAFKVAIVKLIYKYKDRNDTVDFVRSSLRDHQNGRLLDWFEKMLILL